MLRRGRALLQAAAATTNAGARRKKAKKEGQTSRQVEDADVSARSTLPALKAACRARGLPVSGTKPVLLGRLGIDAESSAESNSLLRLECTRLGIASGGTKAEMSRRLSEVARPGPASYYSDGAHLLLPIEKTFLSLDLGFRNFAYAYVALPGHVLAWSRVAIDLPPGPYQPAPFALAISQFIKTLPKADAVVIEAQRHRSGGGYKCALFPPFLRLLIPTIHPISVIEHAVKLRLLELALHAHYLGRSASVQPARVAAHFDLPSGRDKKGEATKRAQALIEQSLTRGAITFSDEAKRTFEAQRKQDDMSDALIQALAVIQWRAHHAALAKK